MLLFRIHNFLKKSNNIHDYLRRLITLLTRVKLPISFCAKLYDIHYKYVDKKLAPLFNIALNNTKKEAVHNKHKNSKIIWYFWYQGTKSMPKIIRKCFLSIKKHSTGHKLILLTKYNVKRYAKLPNYIYHKVSLNEITLTHFSDIIRFNLLRNYGGLWIDSTVFCVNDLPSECFNRLYTVRQGYLKSHSNVSLGKWSGFIIGGNSNLKLFIFMDNFFKLYWKYNDNLLDYFLIDCALNYAYLHNISNFKNYILSCEPNPFICIMTEIGNKHCTCKEFNKLISKTPFFKLTYKTSIKNKKNTYYSFLLK